MEITGTRERGTSTVEFVGISTAAAVLMGALALGMSGHGGAIASNVVAGIERAIRGGGRELVDQQHPRRNSFAPEIAALSTTRERRWETSEDAPRVSRSDLRMNPVLPGLSVWDSTAEARAIGPDGLHASIASTTCVLCIDAGWRDGFRTGLSTSGTLQPTDGSFVTAELQGEGRGAVVGFDLIGIVQQRSGWASWTTQARVRGTVGADFDARLTGSVGRDGFTAAAGGGAMAGAVIRGEARAGMDLLGVAVTARGRAEGWAGAGARAQASVSRKGSAFSWDAELGAALGLGGSLEWGGSIDVSDAPPKHRAAASSTLATAANVVLPGIGGLFQRSTPSKGH